jgi:hypothetical protein
MSIKRYDGSNWVEPSSIKRFDGSKWVDVEKIMRYDGSNWVSVYLGGTHYYLRLTGIDSSSVNITVASDGTITFYGNASSALISLCVMIDYVVPANNPFDITVTSANILRLPSMYLGFSNTTGLKDVSVSKTLTTTATSYKSGSLTPTVNSYPYALFMLSTSGSISVGTQVGFTLRFDEVINVNTSERAPTPFVYDSSKNKYS